MVTDQPQKVANVTEAGMPATKKAKAEEGDYKVNEEFLRLLLHTKVEHFHEPGMVIYYADRTFNAKDVWAAMSKKNFLSVPVLQHLEHKWWGFMDQADIVRYMLEKFGTAPHKTQEEFWAKMSVAEAFGTATVDDIMKYPLSMRNPFHPITKGFSLLHAIEMLARHENLHHLPVVDSDRHLVNIISQSRIIAFLNASLDKLGNKANQPLRQCLNWTRAVESVSEDDLVCDAFSKMVTNNLTGLAVVNSTGRIVDNISVRDLKALKSDIHMFWRLYQTTKNYMRKLDQEFEEVRKRPRHLVVATEDETLGDIIRKLADNHIHRIYVVNTLKDKHPIGVISLKDVLCEILND